MFDITITGESFAGPIAAPHSDRASRPVVTITLLIAAIDDAGCC